MLSANGLRTDGHHIVVWPSERSGPSIASVGRWGPEFPTPSLPIARTCETLRFVAGRSKVLVLSIAVLILVITGTAVHLRSRLRCAGFSGPGVSEGELPGDAPAEGCLRIATWNLRNFPLDERPQEEDLGYMRRTNICDLETILAGLDADLLGLQEVNDIRRFRPILGRATGERRMEVRFSSGGGRFGQHLAFAWNDSELELIGEPLEVSELALEPGMRPGFGGYLRSRRSGGIDFTLVVVHLESGPDNFGDRRRQNRALARWIEERVEAIDDPDVVVLGDFNTTGSPRGGLGGELQSIDSILGGVGLERLDNAVGCSSYWEGGGERDGVQVPSLLDHVFIGGFGAAAVTRPVEAWLHCARLECSELVSRPGQEDGTFWDVSDHCPLTFEIHDANLERQNSD